MCRQYDSVLASPPCSFPSALTQVLLPLCLRLCLCFCRSVWLSYQRPWASSPAQTNHRSVLWLAHKAIRQGRGEGQGQGLSRDRLGGMPQTPVQRFSHDSSDDVADTAAGHGNWELGTGMGTRLGKRQMSMSQPKIQKWRAKSDAKKKTKRKARNEKRQNETQRR